MPLEENKMTNYDVVMLSMVERVFLLKMNEQSADEVVYSLVVIICIYTHTHLPATRNVYPSMDPFGWLTVIIFNFYRSSEYVEYEKESKRMKSRSSNN